MKTADLQHVTLAAEEMKAAMQHLHCAAEILTNTKSLKLDLRNRIGLPMIQSVGIIAGVMQLINDEVQKVGGNS
jgi:hypothetical protein